MALAGCQSAITSELEPEAAQAMPEQIYNNLPLPGLRPHDYLPHGLHDRSNPSKQSASTGPAWPRLDSLLGLVQQQLQQQPYVSLYSLHEPARGFSYKVAALKFPPKLPHQAQGRTRRVLLEYSRWSGQDSLIKGVFVA